MGGCMCRTMTKKKKQDRTHCFRCCWGQIWRRRQEKNINYSVENCDGSCFFSLFLHAFFHLSCDAKFLTSPIALMLHIISGFTAESLLTPACLQIRILQIRGIQLGGQGREEYESGLNIVCTAPENVTKSFELTEKMRKLIASAWFIYTW